MVLDPSPPPLQRRRTKNGAIACMHESHAFMHACYCFIFCYRDTWTYIYIHTCTHTYIHTCTHTCIHEMFTKWSNSMYAWITRMHHTHAAVGACRKRRVDIKSQKRCEYVKRDIQTPCQTRRVHVKKDIQKRRVNIERELQTSCPTRRMHIKTQTFFDLYICTNTSLFAYNTIFVCLFWCIYIYMYICIFMYVCMYVYMYVYIYMFMYLYIHCQCHPQGL